MSSCQGELAGKSFYVTAVDQEGTMLVNGTVSTLRNGFFELWLPRKRIIDLRIQGFNRVAQGKITTYDSSKTCVTTFRLH
ncbi:MAG: CueP family metal-binding protein [Desulfobacterales bacterium]|jgi:hypothetical protein